jgi:hypothetical protein
LDVQRSEEASKEDAQAQTQETSSTPEVPAPKDLIAHL